MARWYNTSLSMTTGIDYGLAQLGFRPSKILEIDSESSRTGD